MKKLVALFFGVALMAMAFVTSTPPTAQAEGFENLKNGAVKWKVIDYNRVQTHPARVPEKIAGGIALDFLFSPDTAFLGTSHPSYRGDLLGDLSGKTISATVGVTVNATADFDYYGEPDACGRPANVRLYFQTDTSGKFEETDYWWSNPVSVDLEALKAGDFNLMETLANPSRWSDYYGHYGSDPLYASAFIAATQDVQFIGVSFGGGCFFANGVGIKSGTGSGKFRLMDFTVAP